MVKSTPMTSKAKTIRVLIADSDPHVIRTLVEALTQAQFQPLSAKDGSQALELSVLNSPDIILFDEHCPFIDARRFAAVLRANPRTQNTPFFILSEAHLLSETSDHHLGFFKKPLDIPEVISTLKDVAGKMNSETHTKIQDRTISGNFIHISLIELLQIFATHQKTGTLAIQTQQGEGALSVKEGRIKEVRYGRAIGRKALYRLLNQSEGDFSFVPGKQPGEGTMDGAADILVAEGLWQIDELHRLMPELGPPEQVIERTDAVAAKDIQPLARLLLDALVTPQKLSDLLEMSPGTDFEVVQALHNLLRARIIAKRGTCKISGKT